MYRWAWSSPPMQYQFGSDVKLFSFQFLATSSWNSSVAVSPDCSPMKMSLDPVWFCNAVNAIGSSRGGHHNSNVFACLSEGIFNVGMKASSASISTHSISQFSIDSIHPLPDPIDLQSLVPMNSSIIARCGWVIRLQYTVVTKRWRT